MYKIVDKFILLALCGLIYLTTTSNSFTIVFILIALVAGNACGYFENTYIRITVVCIYFLITLFEVDACYFIPYVVYDSFFKKEKALLFIFLLSYLLHFSSFKATYLFLFTLLWGCSWYLNFKTSEYKQLKETNKRIKDDSEELKILQDRRHKQLLEKQDYEIQLAKAEERNRIAREIHDSVGHNLSSSLLQIGAMIAINKEDSLKEPLQNMKETLSDGMNSIRNSVHDLHQDTLNLKEEMEKLVQQFKKCPIHLQYKSSNFINLQLKYCFINILKEALNNINKHSNCTNVEISFFENPNFYQFSIHDNGTIKQNLKDGLGLKSMQERVYSFDGICNITNEQGFKIFINIPKQSNDK